MQLVQLIVAQKADWVLLNSEAGSNFYVICCEYHQLIVAQLLYESFTAQLE